MSTRLTARNHAGGRSTVGGAADSGTHTPRFRFYRPSENHPDWSELFLDARMRAVQLRPLLQPPVALWREFQRRARSWSRVVRNHQINRRLARAGREDFRPLYLLWTTQRSCNFRCTYCDDHQGARYPDLRNEGVLGTDQAVRMLEIMRTKTPSVLLAGGEPTLRKDLPVITRAARNLNYYPIIVDTNGSVVHRLLAKPEWSSWLADVDHLVVSLDALETEVLTSMWRYANARDVLRNILLLRELAGEMRFELMISTVIQPNAIRHACDVLNWSNDLGICFCPMPKNVGPTIDRSLLHDEDYRRLVALILDRKRAGYRIAGSLRMNERLLTAEKLECRNTLKPHIDHNGNLFWPCKPSVEVEPLEVNVLEFNSVDEIYDYASAIIDPTGFQNRCGAHCNWSQHYTTDAYAYGLKHAWSILLEIVGFLRAV